MDPPFYVLSSGDESSDGNTPDTSLSGSSHDTSRAKYHIPDVKAFAEDLNQAAKNAFPNRGRSRYDTVNACLIRWEQDELNVDPELNRLDHKFQDYGFATNTWLIPSRDSHLELMSKTIDLIRASDNDRNLFIVYYAGHGRINSARQAEWTCNQDPNYASVDWSAIQSLLAKAKSDVLVLLDTCAAASSTMRSQYGVMEAIVACGFESRAAPPGEYSFTNTLIEVLDDWQNKRSFSASCLHAEILFQLKLKENRKGREGVKLEWCSTPIHINYTHDSKAPGIELCRRNVLPPPEIQIPSSDISSDQRSTFVDAMDIDLDDNSTTPSPLSSLSTSGDYRTPHVIIRIGLEQQQPPMDVKQCLRWLENIPILGKWATIEGIYPSYSTLLIVSVPIAIWNMLPDNPACSFIGYVTAPSFTRSFPKPNTSKTPTITAAEPSSSESFRSRMIERKTKSYTSQSGSAFANPKGQQRYSDPRVLPTPPSSEFNSPRDVERWDRYQEFRRSEPNNKSWDRGTVPIDPREIRDTVNTGGLEEEKNEHILQSSIARAPADSDGPAKDPSTQTTKGTAWNQFAENESRFGLTIDYNENFDTTKIDKSHPDRMDPISHDIISPEVIAALVEKIRKEIIEERKQRDMVDKTKNETVERLKHRGTTDDFPKPPSLHRAPSNSSSSTSSPPPTARRVYTPPLPTSSTRSKDSGFDEHQAIVAERERRPYIRHTTSPAMKSHSAMRDPPRPPSPTTTYSALSNDSGYQDSSYQDDVDEIPRYLKLRWDLSTRRPQ